MSLRREQIMRNLKGHTEDRPPSAKVLHPCWEKEKTKSKCFAWSSVEVVTEWLFYSARGDLSLLDSRHIFKEAGNIVMLVEDRIQTSYQNYITINTDGFKDASGETAYAFTNPSLGISVKRRASDQRALHTAELIAISVHYITKPRNTMILFWFSAASLSTQSFPSQSRQDLIIEL